RPWLYEAQILRSDLDVRRAGAAPPAEAEEHRRRALGRLERALEIAPSSASALLGRCRLGTARLRVALVTASIPRDRIDAGRRHCRELTEGLSGSPEAWAARSEFERAAGGAADQLGDPAAVAVFEHSVELASTAVLLARSSELAPRQSAVAESALGAARRELAVELAERGDDVRAKLRRAASSLERAIAIEATPDRFASLGEVLVSLARQTSRRGGDAGPIFERATTTLERAVDLAPESPDMLLKQASAWQNRGIDELDHGRPAAVSFERSIDAASRAVDADADSFLAFYRRAVARWYLADALSLAGGDGVGAIEAALVDTRRALELDATFPNALLMEAQLAQALATAAPERGADPEPHLVEALEALDRTERAAPSMVWVDFVRGSVLKQRALWRWGTVDPAEAPLSTEATAQLLDGVRAARASFRRGLDRHDGEAHAWTDLAVTWSLEFQVLGGGTAARRAWRRAESAFARALGLDPGCAPCLEGFAELRLAGIPAGLAQVDDAVALLLRAREIDAANPTTAVALAEVELVRCEAEGRCDGFFPAAVGWLERADGLRSGDPRTMAVRGAVHGLGAELGVDGASLEVARTSLEDALGKRPDLRRSFAPRLARLESLGRRAAGDDG
ncbi:MAG: hypothetical protein AAGM22_29595, partial [Acidobacteriota bacterium]